jgi:tripartite-type tricarboxylate transporter receptor subunit TctC
VVPLAPGGGNDTLARYVGKYLTESLGQSVVIENRAGGGGLAGGEYTARAAPDGYTLVVAGSGLIVVTLTHKQFNFQRDLTPIAPIGEYATLLVAHPSLPVKNVRELIALARAQPGAINYASTGSGSSGHLTMELFRDMARIDLVHVPYKVISQALADLMAGQVSLWFPTLPGALPHIKAGRIAALAVAGGKRTAALSTTPTVAESGLPGFEASSWYGVLAPAGASNNIVEQLHARFAAIVTTPAMQEKLAAQGLEPVASTPAQLATHLKSEVEKWARVVKASGVRAE